MKRLFAILFALFCTMPLFCQDREVDSLLRVLDASVQGRERYTLERQSQINALQCQLKATRSDAELLEIYQELFGKYSTYRMDSALWAANRCVEVAQRMPVASHLYSARMRVAEVMIGTGMYKEGLEILEDIPQEELGAIDMFYYYNLYHKVYTLMASYAFSEELQASYSRLAYQYKDSILRVKRPDSQGYQLTLGDKLLYEGKYDEAIGVLEGCYDIHSQKDFSLAIPFCCIGKRLWCQRRPQAGKEISYHLGNSRRAKRNKGIHFALETCQPALWRGRHRTCVYLYGMLHARCYLL